MAANKLSDVLQVCLAERDISAKEAALQMGVSPSLISRYINGQGKPSVGHWGIIARWCRVDQSKVWDLLEANL